MASVERNNIWIWSYSINRCTFVPQLLTFSISISTSVPALQESVAEDRWWMKAMQIFFWSNKQDIHDDTTLFVIISFCGWVLTCVFMRLCVSTRSFRTEPPRFWNVREDNLTIWSGEGVCCASALIAPVFSSVMLRGLRKTESYCCHTLP